MCATLKLKSYFEFSHRFYPVLKFAAVTVCITLFIILMADVWNKFSTKMTTTGFQVIEHLTEYKEFPCFTIRPPYPYKKRGFYWTKSEYQENTFGLEDIFAPQTIDDLKNSSRFEIKEVKTTVNGRVFAVCPVGLFKTIERIRLHLIKNREFEMLFLNPGDEFWFAFPRFLIHSSCTLIDTQKTWSADVAIAEQRKKFLMKDGHSYNEYEDKGFASCIKDALTFNFEKQLECILPGLEETVRRNKSFVYCIDETSAKKAFHNYIDSIYEVLTKPSAYQCPVSCIQSVFDINVKYFHETAFIPVDVDESLLYGKVFYIDVFYSSLNVEEHVEKLIYDVGTFLAAAGGNLGLMLVVSCLSILYTMINFLRGQVATFNGISSVY